MGAFHPVHLIIVAVVILLLFGPTVLRNLAKGLGQTARELKKVQNSLTESEPVTLVKDVGGTFKEMTQTLNPLAPPAPPKADSARLTTEAVKPAPLAEGAPRAGPDVG